MWILAASIAAAATLSVPGDFPSIAEAIASAGDGATIQIDPGAYTESVTVEATTLTFEGQPGVVWVPEKGPALRCAGGASCTVRDLTFDGAYRDQGIVVTEGGSLSVSGSRFVRGLGYDGGAIEGANAATIEISDAVFYDNEADHSGGHLHVEVADAVLVQRSAFVAGRALGQDGGGIRIDLVDDVALVGLWLAGNETYDDGGAVHITDVADASLRRSMLCDNVAPDQGGALGVRFSTIALVGNIFSSNAARAGGGAFLQDSALTSRNNHFVGNAATADGSAIASTLALDSINDLYAYNTGAIAHSDATAALSYDLFWENDGGNTNSTFTADTLVFGDPALGAWAKGCDPEAMELQDGSEAIDAGAPEILDADGSISDIGATGGPEPYDPSTAPIDADADGADAVVDCDDADPDRHPAAPEGPGDGVDQDCDGTELCYLDGDGDGYGEAKVVPSADYDCADPGEAPANNDRCEGYDDAIDTDGDGTPDGCDPTPTTPSTSDPGGNTGTGTNPDTATDDSVETDAGAVGVKSPPEPPLGCGCADRAGPPTAFPSLALSLGLVAVRRRRARRDQITRSPSRQPPHRRRSPAGPTARSWRWG